MAAAAYVVPAVASVVGGALAGRGSKSGSQSTGAPALPGIYKKILRQQLGQMQQLQQGVTGFLDGNLPTPDFSLEVDASPLEGSVYGRTRTVADVDYFTDALKRIASTQASEDVLKNFDEITRYDINAATADVMTRAGASGSIGSSVNRQIADVAGRTRLAGAEKKASYTLAANEQAAGAAAAGLQFTPNALMMLASIGAQDRSRQESNLTRRLNDFYMRNFTVPLQALGLLAPGGIANSPTGDFYTTGNALQGLGGGIMNAGNLYAMSGGGGSKNNNTSNGTTTGNSNRTV